MENLSHVVKELESFKKLVRNLEEKLETDILPHQKEITEYEKDERLTLILRQLKDTSKISKNIMHRGDKIN
jgi:hypothetical protein